MWKRATEILHSITALERNQWTVLVSLLHSACINSIYVILTYFIHHYKLFSSFFFFCCFKKIKNKIFLLQHLLFQGRWVLQAACQVVQSPLTLDWCQSRRGLQGQVASSISTWVSNKKQRETAFMFSQRLIIKKYLIINEFVIKQTFKCSFQIESRLKWISKS